MGVPIENPYLGLNYQAWNVPNTIGVTVPVRVGGLATHSQLNQLITTADIQLTAGTPSFTVASPYKIFSPLDFWFGCVARLMQGTAMLATQCTITVSGFAKGGQEVATASFTFTPPFNPIGQVPMINAIQPDSFHVPLYNVTIIQTGEINSLWVDNLVYLITK